MTTDGRRQRRRRAQRRRRDRITRELRLEAQDGQACYTKHVQPYPHTCRACGARASIDESTKRCSACGWDEATWLARCPY